MAIMYPRTLQREDVKSPAELAVFGELQRQLADEWLVFHSVSWLVRDPAEGARDGEIDFVVARPERAILCLEVKGGKLACDQASGSATRTVGGRRRKTRSHRRSTTATTSRG